MRGKILIFVLLSLVFSGCASESRVPTFGVTAKLPIVHYVSNAEWKRIASERNANTRAIMKVSCGIYLLESNATHREIYIEESCWDNPRVLAHEKGHFVFDNIDASKKDSGLREICQLANDIKVRQRQARQTDI